MKRKAGIPPYNDPADGSLTPEQIAENVRMSVDGIAAMNIAYDMDMSMVDAFAFVRKNRHSFEAVANATVEDQSIADVARSIKAITSANSSNAAKGNTGPRASRYASEAPAWLEAAKAAAASSTAPTSAVRKRFAKKAIKVISPNVGDDAVRAFFATHWREIDESHRE